MLLLSCSAMSLDSIARHGPFTKDSLHPQRPAVKTLKARNARPCFLSSKVQGLKASFLQANNKTFSTKNKREEVSTERKC